MVYCAAWQPHPRTLMLAFGLFWEQPIGKLQRSEWTPKRLFTLDRESSSARSNTCSVCSMDCIFSSDSSSDRMK